MVYVIGIVGFIGGFAIGQMVLHFLLRHRSKEELLGDTKLRWVYGTLNWAVAVAVCYFVIEAWKTYFPDP